MGRCVTESPILVLGPGWGYGVGAWGVDQGGGMGWGPGVWIRVGVWGVDQGGGMGCGPGRGPG